MKLFFPPSVPRSIFSSSIFITAWPARRGAKSELLGGFAILGGILAFVVSQFIVGLPDLFKQVERSTGVGRARQRRRYIVCFNPAEAANDAAVRHARPALEPIRHLELSDRAVRSRCKSQAQPFDV